MKRSVLPLLAFSLIALVACNQAANNNASSSPYATGSAGASARATGSVAASAQASASASASGANKYITLEVPAPQSGMNAGVDGKGWTVDIIAKGNGPAMDKVKPAFQTTSPTATGRNVNFPGLVVLIKSSSGSSSSGSSPNLAKLFQMIGLPNTLQGAANISSVGTSASSSPAASASSAPSAAGSAATSSKAVDQETAEATWFVQQSTWGSDADVELDVFVVDGDAPDSVSSDTSDLKIVSNIVTVHFHINGGGSSSPSGSSNPSASASPATSGGASPSASPSASSTP